METTLVEKAQVTSINNDFTENRENTQQGKEEIAGEVVDAKGSPENSEYDSAGSYSDEEDGRIFSKGPDDDSRSGSESGGSVILEREEGDGQESVPTKVVDDDVDKKNPQYTPRRGTFYEHDDRTADDVEKEAAEAEKAEKEGKKKIWQDKKEKWGHDRFNDTDQAPKSKSELIAIYGYDIRNEEGPPRARRRRRYGRGPNKYTRNWEDEDAYNKPAPRLPKKPVRPKRAGEEFPPLGDNFSSRSDSKNQNNSQERDSIPTTTSRKPPELNENNGNAAIPNQQRPNNNVEITRTINNSNHHHHQQQQQQQDYPSGNKINQRVGSGRVVKPKKEIKDSDYRGFTTKTRQVRNFKVEARPPPKKEDFIQSQNFTNKNNIQDVEREMGKLNMQDGGHKGGGKPQQQQNNQRQGSVPPRLQSEQKGASKRYSSMRQRSLPESQTPPSYPNTFYPNEYNQQGPPQTSQQPLIHPPATQVPQMNPTAMQPLPQQVPVTAAPLLQPQFPPPFPQAPPAFLQPGVAPPQFMPPQAPQLINYVQGQPAFPPNFQGYQQQFTPVTPPTELYQPQGGITYYSADQQISQRPVPQKRPKAAIPIVAPPSDERPVTRKESELMQPTASTEIGDTMSQNASEEPPADIQQ